jgi:hypothetical protein
MDLGLDEIWFHDAVIHRVVENAETDELGFEVDYPVDWENNVFEPRTIVFMNALRYTVAEGPFHGRPQILEVVQTGEEERRAAVRIETNAGYRTLLSDGVEIRGEWGVV